MDVRRLVNQVYQLPLRYYPQILQLCPTPDEPWLWAHVLTARVNQTSRATTPVTTSATAQIRSRLTHDRRSIARPNF